MQIEITEKEAMGIYSQRYLDSKGKVKRYLPPVIFSVALIAGVTIMYFVHDWLGVAVFIVFSSPSIFMLLKESRASGKYAKEQIDYHQKKALDAIKETKFKSKKQIKEQG